MDTKKRIKAILMAGLLTIPLMPFATATAHNRAPERCFKSIATMVAQAEKERHWKSIGKVRITEYCGGCNDPVGHQSSSGQYLTEGMAACNWLPNGTRIRVDGTEYVITDYCGTNAIDLYRDTDRCYCDLNEYKNVEVYEKWKDE